MNIGGNTPAVEKHILLLKLDEQLHKSECFKGKKICEVSTEERRWLAQTDALLRRVNEFTFGIRLGTIKNSDDLNHISDVQGIIMDACEELKLDLELDGRSDIGSAYSAGDVYRFFSDLKEIIAGANTKITIIDPYFDGSAFNAYLFSGVKSNVAIEILTTRNAEDISTYAKMHKTQFGSNIEVRKSKEIHDRVIFVDSGECWIVGASIKDAGKKPTYLIPLSSELALEKFKIYSNVYNRASITN